MSKRERIEDIMECDLYGVVEQIFENCNLDSHNKNTILSEIHWLITQANELSILEGVFKSDGKDVTDYLRASSIVFDGKLPTVRKARQ